MSSSDSERSGRVQERVAASRDNTKNPMMEVTVSPRRKPGKTLGTLDTYRFRFVFGFYNDVKYSFNNKGFYLSSSATLS